MAQLKRKQMKALATFQGSQCISIFVPTQRVGEGVKDGKSRIVFEGQLRLVRDELKKNGVSASAVTSLLAPAIQMAADSGFWRRMSEGLAVFIREDFFEYYAVPLKLAPYHYVADHFYTRPLFPLFSGDGQFFIMALSLQGVQFFEATRYRMAERFVEELAELRLEEVVGYDYEEKTLQHRSLSTGNTGFHGHGEQNEKRKEEIMQYCRAIDRGLKPVLKEEKAPLVVAAVDYVFALYKEVNKYPYLIEKNLAGNPSQMEAAHLHQGAWEKVEPVFDALRAAKNQEYEEMKHTDRVSFRIEEILPAALSGRIDTLFLCKDEEAYGRVEMTSGKVEVDQGKELNNEALFNLAAVQTFLQKGQVFIVSKQDMPDEQGGINAIFRY